MDNSRRSFIRQMSAVAGGSLVLPQYIPIKEILYPLSENYSALFNTQNFSWGAATSSFQTEGAWNMDGKGLSIWDTFSAQSGKIKDDKNAQIATDFYNRFPEDISLLKQMNFNSLRFSVSWPRILPQGTGYVNQKGIDFYNKIIDNCLEKDITPWLTVYHWDLPQALQNKGGWTNRDVIGWFEEFCSVSAKHFGDRVENWIVMNEPMSFTSLGYMLGIHAPGKRGLHNFLPALHHACLCQSLGYKIIKNQLPKAQVGTTFSCSVIEPINEKPENIEAAKRTDALLNRLFIEPSLGLGYPMNELKFLDKIEHYFHPNDSSQLKCNFDFIGIQYYFRVVVENNPILPIHAREIKPKKRNVPFNTMGFEVFPEGILIMLKKFSSYKGINKIYITECGVCFDDILLENGTVDDRLRINYFTETLNCINKAILDKIPVNGFFAWSLTDNFEWREGFIPRFGLVYIDYNKNLKRYMKDSGLWFKKILASQY